MVIKIEKVDLSHFNSFNITSYFIYTDLISSLLDTKLVDPGSTMAHTAHHVVHGITILRDPNFITSTNQQTDQLLINVTAFVIMTYK